MALVYLDILENKDVFLLRLSCKYIKGRSAITEKSITDVNSHTEIQTTTYKYCS